MQNILNVQNTLTLRQAQGSDELARIVIGSSQSAVEGCGRSCASIMCAFPQGRSAFNCVRHSDHHKAGEVSPHCPELVEGLLIFE
jgi:hypothetical protein